MILEGVYRRFTALKAGKAPLDLRLTHQESVAVAQIEPPGFEMTRAARRFYIAYNGTAPTGKAPVQAFPTTTPAFVISNLDSSKTYFFKMLGAMIFSGTTGLGGQLLACIFQQAPLLTMGTGYGVQSASNGGLQSKAIINSTGTAITQPVTPLWIPVAEQISAAAIVGPGSCIANRFVEARLAVPPGMSLGLTILAPAGTTPLYLPMAEWVEIESDLE
jgi:hypothetical protein